MISVVSFVRPLSTGVDPVFTSGWRDVALSIVAL